MLGKFSAEACSHKQGLEFNLFKANTHVHHHLFGTIGCVKNCYNKLDSRERIMTSDANQFGIEIWRIVTLQSQISETLRQLPYQDHQVMEEIKRVNGFSDDDIIDKNIQHSSLSTGIQTTLSRKSSAAIG